MTVDNTVLLRECNAFVQYLAAVKPDDYILCKYTHAFEPGQCLSDVPAGKFDQCLGKVAVLHPIITRSVDVYCGRFYPGSLVRQKLVLLLAILECRSPTSDLVDRVNTKGKAGLFGFLALQATISGVLLVFATVILGPLHVILGRAASGEATGR